MRCLDCFRFRSVTLFSAIILLSCFALPCFAEDRRAAASEFVVDMTRKALLPVSGELSSDAESRKRFEGFLDADFDLPAISSFVLGHYWKKASDDEKVAFVGVFRAYLARVYAMRLAGFRGDSLRVTEAFEAGESDMIVTTELQRSADEPPMVLAWRVAAGNEWRVTDISVAGISMAQVQRDEFMSVLRQNGDNLSNLMQRLQETMMVRQ